MALDGGGQVVLVVSGLDGAEQALEDAGGDAEGQGISQEGLHGVFAHGQDEV